MNPAVAGFDPKSTAAAWLPARVRPVLGESFKSLCHRLAEANDVSSPELLQLCKAKRPAAKTPIQAVAEAIGVDAAQIEFLTMDSIGKAVRRTPAGWRLRTTVWECQSRNCRGIEDVLRGSAVQFLCLRCNNLLTRPGDVAAPPRPAEEDLIQVQWEILDAMAVKSNEQIKQRLVRLRRCAAAIGMQLLQNEFRELAGSTPQQQVTRLRVGDRWMDSALGIPEIPELVGATLRCAWEISASSHTTYLAVNALGDHQLPDYRQWKLFSRRPTPTPRVSLPTGETTPETVIAAGTRIRQLVRDHGLSPEHVPTEIRRAADPMILAEDVWRWRSHVCTQLRLWLINLEIADNIIASHRHGQQNPEMVKARHQELEVFWEWTELIVPHVTSEEATAFLSQIVELAEQLANLGTTALGDPRVQLSEPIFRRLVPSAAARPVADIATARHWMWLDEVIGHDVYGYVPACHPTTVAVFDRALRPQEKFALRQYRLQQNGFPDYAVPYSMTKLSQADDWWPADSA